MMCKATILGVHSVDAEEPVHLIEILVEGIIDEFDFGAITQEDPSRYRDNWQVAYDEQLLEQSERKARYAFFFHYLDFDKPLLTPFGSLAVPKPSNTPPHLQGIKYEAP